MHSTLLWHVKLCKKWFSQDGALMLALMMMARESSSLMMELVVAVEFLNGKVAPLSSVDFDRSVSWLLSNHHRK